MRAHENCDDLQSGLHDFFTDQRIYGLHVIRNTVKWQLSSERIFVDTVNALEKYYDIENLTPVAYHCPSPELFQCCHFGVHKAVKLVQKDTGYINCGARRTHGLNVVNIEKQWLKRLGLALIGGILGIINKYNYEWVDFNNKDTYREFNKYKDMDRSDLQNAINAMSQYKDLLQAYIVDAEKRLDTA